mmetsp:Transcript_2993/g.7067  ORF Transcript_2993/g.7067 Transcript_2993/m.7067 type:complete len:232 (-) Transcript_2993:870-1565(-)
MELCLGNGRLGFSQREGNWFWHEILDDQCHQGRFQNHFNVPGRALGSNILHAERHANCLAHVLEFVVVNRNLFLFVPSPRTTSTGLWRNEFATRWVVKAHAVSCWSGRPSEVCRKRFLFHHSVAKFFFQCFLELFVFGVSRQVVVFEGICIQIVELPVGVSSVGRKVYCIFQSSFVEASYRRWGSGKGNVVVSEMDALLDSGKTFCCGFLFLILSFDSYRRGQFRIVEHRC